MTTTNPHADLIARYRLAQDAMGGCTDRYCVVRRNKGQHTNGGCRCMYHPDHIATQRAGHIMRLAQDMADALADLDVSETGLCEHQTPLMSAVAPQAVLAELDGIIDQAHADLDGVFMDAEHTGERPDLQDSETMIPVDLLTRMRDTLAALIESSRQPHVHAAIQHLRAAIIDAESKARAALHGGKHD